MTLDSLLALLPDNAVGAISAEDMRTVVTELYRLASSATQVFSYQWTPSATPSNGRVSLDTGWDMTATKVLINETTNSGQVLTFALLDEAASAEIWLTTATTARLTATVTGPSVDQGTYREVPITTLTATGTAPANNDRVSVTVRVTP